MFFNHLFRRHVPPSDPPIPPLNQCLFCGKQGDESHPLKRCSGCKMAKFCGPSCQKAAWVGKPGPGDLSTPTRTAAAKHKDICLLLRERNKPHMLPYQVRVVRTEQGAYIENGDDIPKARPQATKAEMRQLDAVRPVLSDCARDHYFTVVQHLTDEQKSQKYPLACIERWGNDRNDHYDLDPDDEDCHGVVALETMLEAEDRYEDCTACGADGTSFFSFCLNRPVNSNMVHHCEFCHKCFYFRPGCLRGCQHCGKGFYYYDSDEGSPERLAHAAGVTVAEAKKMLAEADDPYDMVITYAEDWRGCNICQRFGCGRVLGLVDRAVSVVDQSVG